MTATHHDKNIGKKCQFDEHHIMHVLASKEKHCEQPTVFSVHNGDIGGGGMKLKIGVTAIIVQPNESTS